MKQLICVLCLSVLSGSALAGGFFPKNAFTNSAAGTTAAVFLKDPVGAPYEALGGGGAVLDGPYSVFWNPAGLARQRVCADGKPCRGEATFSYIKMFETYYKSALSYSRPYGGGVAAVNVLYASQSDLEGFDTKGNYTGDFGAYDLSLGAAYARRFELSRGTLDAGANVKLLRSKLADESASSAALDAGVTVHDMFDESVLFKSVGLCVRNFGPPMSLGSESDPLPFEAVLGTALRFAKNLRSIADLRMPADHSPFLTVGLELGTDEFVGESERPERLGGAIRGGYNTKRQEDIGAAASWSVGGGLSLGDFGVDYAWVPMGDLGNTHRFSLRFSF